MTARACHDLPALRESVRAARRRVALARGARATPTTTPTAAEQRNLWQALERYAEALGQLGAPLPYRMRNELSMYRALFAIRRGT